MDGALRLGARALLRAGRQIAGVVLDRRPRDCLGVPFVHAAGAVRLPRQGRLAGLGLAQSLGDQLARAVGGAAGAGGGRRCRRDGGMRHAVVCADGCRGPAAALHAPPRGKSIRFGNSCCIRAVEISAASFCCQQGGGNVDAMAGWSPPPLPPWLRKKRRAKEVDDEEEEDAELEMLATAAGSAHSSIRLWR